LGSSRDEIDDDQVQKTKLPRIHKYDHIKSKVGSLDNIKHRAQGGGVCIYNRMPKIEARSKVGSLEHLAYRPGGGAVTILDVAPSLKYLRKQKKMKRIMPKEESTHEEEYSVDGVRKKITPRYEI
jgi:hypothetical protein